MSRAADGRGGRWAERPKAEADRGRPSGPRGEEAEADRGERPMGRGGRGPRGRPDRWTEVHHAALGRGPPVSGAVHADWAHGGGRGRRRSRGAYVAATEASGEESEGRRPEIDGGDDGEGLGRCGASPAEGESPERREEGEGASCRLGFEGGAPTVAGGDAGRWRQRRRGEEAEERGGGHGGARRGMYGELASGLGRGRKRETEGRGGYRDGRFRREGGRRRGSGPKERKRAPGCSLASSAAAGDDEGGDSGGGEEELGGEGGNGGRRRGI